MGLYKSASSVLMTKVEAINETISASLEDCSGRFLTLEKKWLYFKTPKSVDKPNIPK